MNAVDESIRIGTARVGSPQHGAIAGSIADFIAGFARRLAARRAEARAAREAEDALAGMSDRGLRDIGLRRDQLLLPGRGL